MKGLATPVFLLIMCLGLVWFANTNSETVDGWFEGVKIIDNTIINEIASITEGSYYVVAKGDGGNTKKLTNGAIPTPEADDMFVHNGFTYVYIVPVNATAIRYGLEGNKWYIYATPGGDALPLTRINGIEVVPEPLEELMKKEQDHVVGDEQQTQQPTQPETVPPQQPQTVPPQSQGNELDDSFYNDWSGSSGPSWGDSGSSGPSWGDSGSSGPSW